MHAPQPPDIKDILLGIWENDLDDGSGLHAIWGWSFDFKADGTGKYSYWNKSKLELEMLFEWRRVSVTKIQIKYQDDDEWSTVEYALSEIDGPYNSKLLKLIDINYQPHDHWTEGFWDAPGALFKHLPR